MNKKIIWALIILLVLIGGYFLFKPKNSSANNTNNVATTTPVVDTSATSTNITSSSTKPSVKTYTLAEVSTHSSSASCWAAIEGKVYDLTSWIGQHPGGEDKILSICGKDGTQAFDGQHGMDPRAKGVLPNFYLGNLVN